MTKVTDAVVKAMIPPETGNWVIWDGELTGFGVRITAAGARSFVLRYVFNDPDALRRSNEYRYTIGAYPIWSVVAARSEAKTWVQRIARGETHPMAEKVARRTAVKARQEAECYAEAVEDYIAREQEGRRRNSTADEAKRVLLREGAIWADTPLMDLTAREIRKRLETIRDGGKANQDAKPRPYLANRFYAYLSTFFSWAAEPGIEKVGTSPMIGLKRPWEGEAARERVFDDDEIKGLWKAADMLGGVPGAYLKMAILTGKRRSALASMRWEDIDDWVWNPPADPRLRKRNKRLHSIPLPALAQRVIAPLKQNEGFVFPGRTTGSRINGGAPFQKKIRAASGVDDFFLHACRHTLETRLAELRVPPHIRDLVLDHAPSRGSGAGYDHHSYADEMLEALESWAQHVEKVVTPEGARALR